MQVFRKKIWHQIFKNMRNKVCSVASTDNNLKEYFLSSLKRVMYQVSKKEVMRLINNKTTAFCLIFKISFVWNRSDPHLHFDIPFLKIRQKLTELGELEDKNVVGHEE